MEFNKNGMYVFDAKNSKLRDVWPVNDSTPVDFTQKQLDAAVAKKRLVADKCKCGIYVDAIDVYRVP